MSEATRLKRVALSTAGGTPTVDDPLMWDDRGLPWVAISDMTRSFRVTETDRRVSMAGIASKALPIGKPGTLLFAMYASVGQVAVLDVEASWNQAILGIEPRRGQADSRFIRYWLEHLRRDLGALTRSNTQDNLNADQVANLPFPTLSVGSQRAIADYLDRETTRIDSLVAARRRMAALIAERAGAEVEDQIRALAATYGETPLKFACREVVVGIVITPSAWYTDDQESGVPAIRGTNVSAGRFDLSDLVYLTPEGHGLHAKSELHAGEVVVVRTGQAGAAAVVPANLDGSNCIDLVIIRPLPKLDPSFLEFVLNSDWTQKHVDKHSVGTIQSHFNVGAMKDLPVPLPPLAHQREVVDHLRRATDHYWAIQEALNAQVALLEEHRGAVISAAVTGQREILEAR